MADTINQQVADRLREAADVLALQGANPFRVSAYRKASDTVSRLDRDLRDIADKEGFEGLVALPGVGRSIAAAIHEMLRTGRWSQLDCLRGTLEPERLFRALPGVGPELAHRIHDTLHIETLEALEIAAHDGRLEAVAGIGPRRAAMLRATLAGMLSRARPRPRVVTEEPPVELLLDVDREYRRMAAADTLPKIAPRRFNPRGEAWLPVLHTQRDDWHFTALFSNTARAHELSRTHDWVVLYAYTDSMPETQRTVVSETRGARAGRRVVRGREDECRRYHDSAGGRA
ncbi:MAG: helix-hairpin-helix domain-containing protein [Alphaproteobacteria bacterium]